MTTEDATITRQAEALLLRDEQIAKLQSHSAANEVSNAERVQYEITIEQQKARIAELETTAKDAWRQRDDLQAVISSDHKLNELAQLRRRLAELATQLADSATKESRYRDALKAIAEEVGYKYSTDESMAMRLLGDARKIASLLRDVRSDKERVIRDALTRVRQTFLNNAQMCGNYVLVDRVMSAIDAELKKLDGCSSTPADAMTRETRTGESGESAPRISCAQLAKKNEALVGDGKTPEPIAEEALRGGK